MTDTLPPPLPCPMCGAEKGYTLSGGSTFRWWLVSCAGCGRDIGECRADPDLPYTAPTPETWGRAYKVWNDAAQHAADLRAELANLAQMLAEHERAGRCDCGDLRQWLAGLTGS